MPTVDITLGKRVFQLVCGDGQEGRLRELAAEVGARVDHLAESLGNHNDTLLLVMTSLMMQDELNELKQRASANAPRNGSSYHAVFSDDAQEAGLAHFLDEVADTLETLAIRAESA